MLLDLGFLILLTIVVSGFGLGLMNWLKVTPDHPLDAWALALPMGLGSLALVVLGLGELGVLTPNAISLILILGLVTVGKEGWAGTARAIRSMRWVDRPTLAFDAAMLITLSGSLLTALAPVTDGDALCYHLQVPKIFLAHHSNVFEPDLHETIYPLVTEMLYAVALGVRGPVACRLIQWLLGLVFAANVAALARPILGDRARWAAAVALLVPAVSNGMGAPLNDVALAAFGNASLLAWTRWRDRPSAASAILAGMLAGMAMGVKYPALVLAGLIGLGFLVGRHPVQWKHALIFGLVTLLVGGSWYLRGYIHTGNPVYPFFRHLFGGSGIDEVLAPIKRPMAVTAWNLAIAIGPLTLQPGRFDSFSHQFGPVFLLFLPALLWMRPPRRVWELVAVGYAFFALCLTQRQSMRFVLIAVGPLSVGVAWLAVTWWDGKRVAGRVLVGILLVSLAFEATLAASRARHGLRVVFGFEAAEAYLASREPTFEVGRWMGAHLPEDARVIGQDHRGFYLPRDYVMELAHRRRTGLGKAGESADQVINRLRSEGFTHLLLCPPQPINAVEFDPTLSHLLEPWLAEASPLYRRDLGDADGVVRRYAIYALDQARPIKEARR